jgi:alpha-tubulin suppressor-like RCC1 family protein
MPGHRVHLGAMLLALVVLVCSPWRPLKGVGLVEAAEKTPNRIVHWGHPIISRDDETYARRYSGTVGMTSPQFAWDETLGSDEEVVQIIMSKPSGSSGDIYGTALIQTSLNRFYMVGEMATNLATTNLALLNLSSTPLGSQEEILGVAFGAQGYVTSAPASYFFLTKTSAASTWNIWLMSISEHGLNVSLIPFWSTNEQLSSISCTNDFCIVLNASGTPYMWGANTLLQYPGYDLSRVLGDGSQTLEWPTPQTPVNSLGLNLSSSVALGKAHVLAMVVEPGGGPSTTVVAWGSNVFGQLGNAVLTGTNSTFAVDPVIAVAAGSFHSLLLHANGSVTAFGRNIRGQLGRGTHTDLETVPSIVLGLSDCLQISSWGDSSFALCRTGPNHNDLFAWGSNSLPMRDNVAEYSQEASRGGFLGLGVQLMESFAVPTTVPLPSNLDIIHKIVTPVSACSDRCTLYLIANKTTTSPSVPDSGAPSSASTPASSSTQVLLSFGTGFAPGNSRISGLLTPFSAIPRSPAVVVDQIPLSSSSNFTHIVCTGSMAAVLDASDASVWYWGNIKSSVSVTESLGPETFVSVPWNYSAHSGRSPADLQFEPRNSRIHGLYETSFTHFASTPNKAAGATVDGDIVVFGVTNPEAICVGCGPVLDLVGGKYHMVALLSNRSVVTWSHALKNVRSVEPLGWNNDTSFGPFGLAQVENVTKIAAGDEITVVAIGEGSLDVLYSFGSPAGVTPLGNESGITQSTSTPVAVNVSSLSFTKITKITCGTRRVLFIADGKLYGWGNLPSLGIAPPEPVYFPIPVSLSGDPENDIIVDIAAFAYVDYALTSEGLVYGVGYSTFGLPYAYYVNFGLGDISTPTLLPLNDLGGTKYKVTKLMASLNVDIVQSMSPLLVLATPIGPSDPVTPHTHDLYSWGANELDVYSNQLGLETFNQRTKTPAKMFSFSNPNPGFPFDTSGAKFAFGLLGGYAVAPDGAFYTWGTSTAIMSGSFRPQFQGYYYNISHMVPYDGGLILIENNGQYHEFSTGAFPIFIVAPISDFMQDHSMLHGSCSPNLCAFVRRPINDQTFTNTSVILFQSSWTVLTTKNVRKVVTLSPLTETPTYPIYSYLIHNSSSNATNFATGTFSTEPALFDESTPLGGNRLASMDEVLDFIGGAYHVLVLLRKASLSATTGSGGAPAGDIWGWGINDVGQLAPDSSTALFLTPINVMSELNGHVERIGAFGKTSFAVLTNGSMFYWGSDNRNPSEIIPGDAFGDIWDGQRTQGAVRIEPPPGLRFSRLFSSTHGHTSVLSSSKRDTILSKLPTHFRSFVEVGVPSVPTSETPFSGGNPTASSCPQPAPIPSSVCEGSAWVVHGNLVIGPSTAIVLTGDVKIDGDLTVTGSDSLIFTADTNGKLPFLNVSGCAQFSDGVTVQLTEQQTKELAKQKDNTARRLIESSCSQQGDLTKLVNVNTPKSCRKVKAITSQETSDQDRSTLSVAFKVDSSACNRWWIILLSVLGGAITITGIIFVAVFANKNLRMKVLPYRGTNTN